MAELGVVVVNIFRGVRQRLVGRRHSWVGGWGGMDPDQRLGFRDLIRSAQMQSEKSDSIENSRESDGIRFPEKKCV